MLNKTDLVKVTNRNRGTLSYRVADLGIKRHYEPNETKEVTIEEMIKLSYSTGGKALIEKYLQIQNEELVNIILGEVEPEYYYTEEDIIELLTNGSLDQLEDCLNFGVSGVIDMVKELAVKLEINDIRKRNMIKAKTNFDVSNAIKINHIDKENEVEVEQVKRRSTPINTNKSSTPERKTTPKYKVTSIKN